MTDAERLEYIVCLAKGILSKASMGPLCLQKDWLAMLVAAECIKGEIEARMPKEGPWL